MNERSFIVNRKHEIGKCQGGELNSRPRAYESPALPLSYPGARAAKVEWRVDCVNAPRRRLTLVGRDSVEPDAADG